MNFFRNLNVPLEGLYCTTLPVGKVRKWKHKVDNGQAFGVLFIDLSKASDSLPHEVLITVLNAQCFGLKALKLVNNYLSQANQRK